MDEWDSKAAVAAIKHETNGTAAEAAAEGPHVPRMIILRPGDLRRLARLQARLEGALGAAQAAQQVAQVTQQALRDGLAEVLEEEGVDTRGLGDAQLSVDWRTGVMRLP